MQPIDIPLGSASMSSSVVLIVGPVLAVIIVVYLLVKSQSTFWGRVNTILKNIRSIITLAIICFLVILVVLLFLKNTGKGSGSQGGISDEVLTSLEAAVDASKFSTFRDPSEPSILVKINNRENLIRIYRVNDTTSYNIRMDGDIEKEIHHALRVKIGDERLYVRNPVNIEAEMGLSTVSIPFRLRVHSILKKHNLLPYYTEGLKK